MTPHDEIRRLLDRQDGLIGRRQALAAGLTPTAIARLLRRRDWVAVHPGVYVDHNGPLTWTQRAWAAVLACWPSGLDAGSALRAHEGPGRRTARDDGPIEVVVDHRRRVRAPSGVRVRRTRRLEQAIQWHLSPPRLRYEDAVLALADAGDPLTTVAVLTDAVGGRRTTAARLLERVDEIPWLHQRERLGSVLADAATGTCSVLEHAYLTQVERAHGLPRSLRQAEARDDAGRRLLRDVLYGGERPRWRQVVELDGRAFHTSARQRDRDLERDLDASLTDHPTVRLGYPQVLGRPCLTATKVARLLQRRGWAGEGHPCPDCPGTVEWGTSGQAG
ncbi:type IV toxin-antitoxin system AbiEi family antitoxin domain-containing protein [Nocardioides sambongensis]|uniref:type IV toxin-antitoxin system AbiEi family antitoxin domain-containing protein n=1 Tax=Nocardioides sambongensis TaxID=2589074 RepID=UPI00112A680C|nr:type IV toxin-antitoxin system AbiEi family antitoxin domain-containing protein [Nocardioides sambongensis]